MVLWQWNLIPLYLDNEEASDLADFIVPLLKFHSPSLNGWASFITFRSSYFLLNGKVGFATVCGFNLLH